VAGFVVSQFNEREFHMSMQEPLDALTVEQMKMKVREDRKRYTVGVVSPDGVVTAHVCVPGEALHGDEPVAWINEQQMLVKRYADRGYRFLHDMCAADGVPEIGAKWRQIVTDRAEGKRVKAQPEEIYPPSVLRLRGTPIASTSKADVAKEEKPKAGAK
jgi:hypothetical protein